MTVQMPDFTPDTSPVPGWTPPPRPARTPMEGRFCRVEPLEAARHADDLFAANTSAENWAWLPYGPFAERAAYRGWVEEVTAEPDPFFHAVIDPGSGRAVGVASLMRINPEAGSIEVGHINFSPLLQRTPAATEAMYLMMRRAFELGYRRYEWKCNAANWPSRNAALRLGFTFEGIHRQSMIVKGCNRDTAWFSILDREWPHARTGFEAWLSPANFDSEGAQRAALGDLRAVAGA